MSKINCWCGNSDLEAFSPNYNLCSDCGTLVYSQSNEAVSSQITEEDIFYSKGYWFEHQTDDLNYPDLISRSREDLSERALYWLRSVLRFCLPPAKSLELGSAHGGFVALLRQAGFDTAGLELSPWVVRYAEEHFQIPMYLGPVEDQEIEPESLDLILLMDVLEHFDDPLSTVQHCLYLLKPDGKLFIQTPEFVRDYSFTEMQHTNHIFLEQLKPIEHIYLFSQESIKEFFHRLGVGYVTFMPPCFPYDMFLVACQSPLPVHSQEEVENALLETAQGRIALALLDIDVKCRKLETMLDESEIDRSARLDIIHESEKMLKKTQKNSLVLEAILHESEIDRANRLNIIQELETKLIEAETDRAARLKNILELESLLDDSEADRAARLNTIQELETKLIESETDRAARLRNILELETLLENSEADRDAHMRVIKDLEKRLEQNDVDHRNRNDLIREMGKKSQESIKDHKLIEEIISKLEEQRIRSENEIRSLTTENQQQTKNINLQAYFLALYEQELSRFPINILLRFQNKFISQLKNSVGKRRESKSIKRVLVDLTPILPGGANGGAKLMATALVWYFSRDIAPECDYVILTSDDAHGELSWLDASNVQRLCVNKRLGINQDIPAESESNGLTTPGLIHELNHKDTTDDELQPSRLNGIRTLRNGLKHEISRIIHFIGVVLERVFPPSVYSRIYRFYKREYKTPRVIKSVLDLEADLLFCPFTAPLYYNPKIPTVIVVYDLQFKAYPQFFSDELINQVEQDFRESCKVASQLICISEYTRDMLIDEYQISPEKAKTIPISLCNPVNPVPETSAEKILTQFGIIEKQYLLYPANFWHHKNHEMLVTVFGMFKERRPDSQLKLVFTGAPGERMTFLEDAVDRIGLGDEIRFAGFVDVKIFSALLQSSLAMIFPSLFEGFGIPILEAMSLGVPVLCSNLTSLPEVGLDAVHYFDPRKPDHILEAIEKIEKDASYRDELIEKGLNRAKDFLDPIQWAGEYFNVFRNVVEEDRIFSIDIFGIYPDHWTGESFEITIPEGSKARFLDFCVELPAWFPYRKTTGMVSANGRKLKKLRVERGQREIIRLSLSSPGYHIKVNFNQTIQPKEVGFGDDDRFLSCQVLWCRLITSEGVASIYEAGIA